MTDDRSDPLAGVFAGFDDEVAPLVKAGGTAVIHRTVRSRRRIRSSALATVLALVVAAPLAYLNLAGEAGPPAGPATTPTVTLPPTTVASSGGPEPGRLGMRELSEATVQIPAWAPDAVVAGCPSGPLRFVGGVHQADAAKAVRLEQVVFVDVDQDGGTETIARFSCGTTQLATAQVLALRRDPAGGTRTVGQVFGQTGEAKAVCDIRPGEGKYTVDVKVVGTPLPRDCDMTGGGIVVTSWGSFNYDWRERTFVKLGEPFSLPTVTATP